MAEKLAETFWSPLVICAIALVFQLSVMNHKARGYVVFVELFGYCNMVF